MIGPFSPNDIVEIHSTTSNDLDGQRCVVKGRASVNASATHYIIDLETPIASDDGFLNYSIQLTQHCLKKI